MDEAHEREINEWCMDGDVVFSDYDFRHVIREGRSWVASMGIDRSGNKWSCVELKKLDILDRYRKQAVDRGLSVDEAEREAIRGFGEYQERLKVTAERVKGRVHKHVAKGMGFMYNEAEDRVVFVYEYVPGIDLLEASKKIKPDKSIFMYAHVLEGLNYIHLSGFLHLNFKYSRAYVEIDANEPVAKLTDWGFAVPLKGYEGEYGYTPEFAAPEVILGQRDKVDERADLYTVGTTWYYCVSGGKLPFPDRSDVKNNAERLRGVVAQEKNVSVPPSHYNREISPELDEFILSLIEKDVDKRKFRIADTVLAFMYEQWPETARRLVHEKTSTLGVYSE
jgi:serine/threonine protein kinase